VFGNHDFYAGEQIVADLQSRLTSLGVTMLVNRATCIAQERGGISVVGLTTEAPGFEEAVDRLLESARPRIALMHEPDLAERLPPDSADLILAGHTHGGQITLPGLEAIIVRLFSGSSYVQGMYRVNGMRMYVNRGLGSTGMPLRFRAHPEVAVIRLAR
jgi:predicted MPP superfamily phosphohydrolase